MNNFAWGLTLFICSLGAKSEPAFAESASDQVTIPERAQRSVEKLTATGTLLGKPLEVHQESSELESQAGIQTQSEIEFLGKQRPLIEASIEALPQLVAGNKPLLDSGDISDSEKPPLARTDWYIGGVRVWNGSLRFDQGELTYSGGVAPTQIPFTVFMYPIGPVVVQVDAGLEFEAELSAGIAPGVSIPIKDSSLKAHLFADASASGYLEGYVKMLLLRAGVGGRVHFIDGKTGVKATWYPGYHQARWDGYGKVRLLNGSVYGFVDSKTLFFGRWKRWLKKDFYRWDGYCYAFGAEKCTP